MRTDPRDLARTPHDVLIVGGGIHGLFAAYDAAARGLSVALVEQDDFGGGLSFNHQRTIHGGLREVGRGRLAKARRQMFERRRWAQMAPHLISPVPFVLGTYGWTSHSRPVLGVGLSTYEWVGRSTQTGVPPGLRLPRARVADAAEVARLFPGMTGPGLTGGAIWYDYQTRFPDRLNWLVALAALGAGAQLSNYAEAVAPLREKGRVAGARVRDLLTGSETDVTAAVTLLAAGSGLGNLATAFGMDSAPPFVRAMNMLVSRPAPAAALAARGPSGRMLTVVPWHGYSLIGTYQSEDAVAPSESAPPASVVGEMLAQVNATFPSLQIHREEIRLVHYGLAPAAMIGGRVELRPDPDIVRCADRGSPGLLALVGVKFTGARAAAEQAVDAVCDERGISTRRCVTGLTPLPHAGLIDRDLVRQDCLRRAGGALEPSVLERVLDEYGTEAPAVIDASVAAGLCDTLTPDTLVLTGEVAYAAERSAAARLADVVLRRTTLGALGHPGRAAMARAASIMGERLGWTPADEEAEIRHAEHRYRVP